MPRELRKRSSRPNYAALLQLGDEEGDATGAQLQEDDDPGSGSDFAPENDAQADVEDDDELPADENELELVEDDPPEPGDVVAEPVASTSRGSKKKPKNVSLIPSMSVPRQTAQLSVHHRHRAVPLYYKSGQVERLVKQPLPFAPDEVASTNAWGSSRTVLNRVAKSWSFNTGPGPLWELVEDRGWYKECAEYMDEGDEIYRRPLVYSDVRIQPALEVLSSEAAKPYIPKGLALDNYAAQEHGFTCSFGPHDKQTRVRLQPFSQISLAQFFPGLPSHVFNTGAPVWGLDWCPIFVDDRASISHRQYLAVAPLPSHEYTPRIGVNVPTPNPACIQIWSLNPAQPTDGSAHEHGAMRCDLVLCIDIGPAHELKWCPLPSHDSLRHQGAGGTPRRLGLLAGTFEDGSLSIFSVPFPDDIRANVPTSGLYQPNFVKVSKPLVRFELEDTACWCLDWANSEVIGVGCTNGSIAIFDVAEALRASHSDAVQLPTHYISAHQSAIRSVAWIRAPTATSNTEISADDPTVIVSAGYDGLLAAYDTRAPCANAVYRTRDVISTVCYAPYCGGPVSIDQGQVKTVSFAPLMFNKGHTVTEPDAALWSVHASDLHPQLAIGVADGSCSTTNTLRTTRRGGTVPFFLHKIYQLDYNRTTKDYRMLEHFLPKEIDKIAGNKTKSVPKASAGWPPEVGVHRVVWNSGNGLGAAGLLASATATGLCRVDWLAGRWSRDRVPYTGIEHIRCEVEADDDMDEDSD